jgi:hypothetical protein
VRGRKKGRLLTWTTVVMRERMMITGARTVRIVTVMITGVRMVGTLMAVRVERVVVGMRVSRTTRIVLLVTARL